MLPWLLGLFQGYPRPGLRALTLLGGLLGPAPDPIALLRREDGRHVGYNLRGLGVLQAVVAVVTTE